MNKENRALSEKESAGRARKIKKQKKNNVEYVVFSFNFDQFGNIAANLVHLT